MVSLFYKRLLLGTLWLFVLPIALDVNKAKELDARQLIQQRFNSQVGVREATGKNDGPEVEAYLATTDLGPGYPWCAAFISWVYEQEGYSKPNTPWTPALFPDSRVIWPDKNKTPQTADVFGIYIPSKKRIAHAGFVEKWGTNMVVCVEGNTNPAGSYEGDGVYRRRRRTKTIHRVADWITNNNKELKK